jgi:hypothetical protein
MTSAELQAKLSDGFNVHTVGQGPELAGSLWNDIAGANQQSRLAFYTAGDNTWTLATISLVGAGRMAQLAQEQSGDWQSLGVSILHRLVMETLLGLTDLPKPMYVHSVEEVIENLVKGDPVGRDATGQMGSGGRFELATLVMPSTVDHVRAISEHGERMPAKSTYFYPKLLGGMVVHLLE